jgi:hypothetical protein
MSVPLKFKVGDIVNVIGVFGGYHVELFEEVGSTCEIIDITKDNDGEFDEYPYNLRDVDTGEEYSTGWCDKELKHVSPLWRLMNE